MRVALVSPGRPGLDTGNQVTARRWGGLLRKLGHRVTIQPEYDGRAADVLVALHARKSFPSVVRFRRARPGRPVVVALTGTDLYGDLRTSARARRSLEIADRLVLLQPAGLDELPPALRAKARVIHQSATRPRGRVPSQKEEFEVVVLAHLRPVKDPLRAAAAAGLRPASSRLRVLHAGAALTPQAARAARREQARNPRYRWLGPLPRGRALRLLARSRALVVSSEIEGGANVVSEALACAVPILCSRIPGSIGILGPDHPGYFEVGDTEGLAALLARAEEDPAFLADLRRRGRSLATLVSPARERESWRRLLRELSRPPVVIAHAGGPADLVARMAEEVRVGLTHPLPSLPCKYFYDDRGSELFDAITRLPEYYQTRTEERILERIAADVIARTRPREIVELGSGLGRKIRMLLEAARGAGGLERVILFDVNERSIEEARARLLADYPGLELRGIVGDFASGDLDLLGRSKGRLAVFFAGTIGNLHPSEVPVFLRGLHRCLAPGDAFLVGLDLVKDEGRLHAAYNDAAGVTADFNRNILRVVNQRLEGDFDPAAFEHVAFYDRERAWIEMRLRARRRLEVRIRRAGLRLRYEAGDEIRTEISCKYTRASFDALLPGTGFRSEEWYTDGDRLFALALLRPSPRQDSRLPLPGRPREADPPPARQAKGSRRLRKSNLRKSVSRVNRVRTPCCFSRAARCASGTRLPRTGKPLVTSR